MTSALLVGFGMVADYPELIMVGLAGIGALVAAMVELMAGVRASVDRTLESDRVGEGARVGCRAAVSNPRRRRSRALELTEVVGRWSSSVWLPGLPGRTGRQDWRYELPAVPRGVYQIPRPSVRHFDFLRLLWAGGVAGEAATLYVHPTVHDIDLRGSSRRLDEVEGALSGFRDEGVFAGLRDYVPGDDARLVHWPSTARAGHLVVRQYSLPPNAAVVVVLDVAAHRYDGNAFEDAVRIAASVCVAALRAGCPLQLRTTRRGSVLLLNYDHPYEESDVTVLDHLADVTVCQRGLLADWPDVVATHEPTRFVVVTGQLDSDAPAGASAALAGGAVRLVQVGGQSGPPQAPAGVEVMWMSNSAHFAVHWNGGY